MFGRNVRNILFHELNAFTWLVAACCTVCGIRVFRYSRSNFIKKHLPTLSDRISQPLSFDACANLPAEDLEADQSRRIDRICEAIYGPDIRIPLPDLDTEMATPYLRSTLHQYMHRETGIVLQCLTWIAHTTHPGTWRLWFPRTLSVQTAIRTSDTAITNSCPWIVTLCACAARLVGIGLSLTRAMATRRARPQVAHQPPPQAQEQEILFFPHKSIFFGKLFCKTLYYDFTEGSRLHPKNILHIEIDSDVLQTEDWSRTLAFLQKHDSRHAVMLRPGPLALAKTLLRQPLGRLLTCIAAVVRSHPKNAFYIVARALAFHAQVLYWKNALSPFPNAKVALIGYEALFPKPLSLALAERGIHTYATQERLHMSFHNQINAVIDTYFTASDFAGAQWKKKPYSHIFRHVPTGLYRVDMLKKYQRPEPCPPAVVVFDFHSELDREFADAQFNVTWKSNHAFYEDILRLAALHPDHTFVIRGKNDAWTTIPFFKDVYEAILASDNVVINTMYDSLDESYKLAANARLIISRPSSIAEECSAIGIPVIIHDYMPHIPHYFSHIMPWGALNPYVHSLEELATRTAAILNGSFSPSSEMDADRQRIFGAYDDTTVQQKIQQHILSHLAQSDKRSL